jgi:hypothetical protein
MAGKATDRAAPRVGGIMPLRGWTVRLNAEQVNDRAKLIMHRLVARRLSEDPSLVDDARARLRRQLADFRFVNEWEHLLNMRPQSLRDALVRRDENMYRLRVSSPFRLSVFGDPQVRRRVYQKAKLGLPEAYVSNDDTAYSTASIG